VWIWRPHTYSTSRACKIRDYGVCYREGLDALSFHVPPRDRSSRRPMCKMCGGLATPKPVWYPGCLGGLHAWRKGVQGKLLSPYPIAFHSNRGDAGRSRPPPSPPCWCLLLGCPFQVCSRFWEHRGLPAFKDLLFGPQTGPEHPQAAHTGARIEPCGLIGREGEHHGQGEIALWKRPFQDPFYALLSNPQFLISGGVAWLYEFMIGHFLEFLKIVKQTKPGTYLQLTKVRGSPLYRQAIPCIQKYGCCQAASPRPLCGDRKSRHRRASLASGMGSSVSRAWLCCLI
jgi:hypothetical protein